MELRRRAMLHTCASSVCVGPKRGPSASGGEGRGQECMPTVEATLSPM